MMEGITNRVNTFANMPIGGNEGVREQPIWVLAKRHNTTSVLLNGQVSSKKVSNKKGTYRPLPLV